MEVVQPSEGRVNWSAAETIRNIQGGVLCKGIYLTDDIDELIKERETIIEVKDNLVFKGPISAVETFRKEFSSRKMAQTFQNNIDKSSSNKGFPGSFSFYGISASYSGSVMSDHNEEIKNSRNENYMAVMHCEKVPLKSIDINRHELSFTPHAVEALRSIENKIKHLGYKSNRDFTEFFEKYGSHATHGVVEFGGILLSVASQLGFEESDLSKVTAITSDASETSLSIGLSEVGIVANLGSSFPASKLYGKTSGHLQSNRA